MKIAKALAMALALTFGTPIAAQDSPLSEVADGVYHFWAMGYSSMVVVGESGVLVTDPSFTPRAEMLKSELAKVTDQPVTHIALSHEHYDHAGGTEVFGGASVICHEDCEAIFRLATITPVPEVDTSFSDRLEIDLGGKIVELAHIAVGDGVATSVARVPGDDVVFSADLYMPREFSPLQFKEDANLVGIREILNTLAAENPAYAINGHSPGNSVEALRENAQMHNDLHDAVEALFNEALATGDPSAPWQLIFGIEGEKMLEDYADWENYEANFPGYARRMALSIFHGG